MAEVRPDGAVPTAVARRYWRECLLMARRCLAKGHAVSVGAARRLMTAARSGRAIPHLEAAKNNANATGHRSIGSAPLTSLREFTSSSVIIRSPLPATAREHDLVRFGPKIYRVSQKPIFEVGR